jgi:hypothetical protein
LFWVVLVVPKCGTVGELVGGGVGRRRRGSETALSKTLARESERVRRFEEE